MLTKLERIKELVEMYPDRKLQTLMHIINEENLEIIHKEQKANKAVGIVQMSKVEYEINLAENLKMLVDNMKEFKYRPQPVKRVYIPKDGSNKLRPLGIPSYEDKLVQGVMAKVLNVIYEPKFLECSYGFRPNRSCHDAIKELNIKLLGKVNYIVDVDIKGFFDNVDHGYLMKFLEHEIEDKNFLRYIGRFLNAGIMEEGAYMEVDKGVPQGGLISPILGNVYLHYVIDLWFEKIIKQKCKGESSMVRYADDNVFCFQYEDEAQEFYKQLKERLAKFNLELSEEKSKIIKFGRFKGGKKDKFDFLGFTITGGKSRKGEYMPIFTTSEKKLKTKRKKAKKWLKDNMHTRIVTLIKNLNAKLRGHYNYYGVSMNIKKLIGFRRYIERELFQMLKRRSQKSKMNWEKFKVILKYQPLVNPTIKVHLW